MYIYIYIYTHYADGYFDITYLGEAENKRQRVVVKLDRGKYSSRVRGVCGNYNGEQADDMNPQGDSTAARDNETITIFNSYKMGSGNCYFCKWTVEVIILCIMGLSNLLCGKINMIS